MIKSFIQHLSNKSRFWLEIHTYSVFVRSESFGDVYQIHLIEVGNTQFRNSITRMKCEQKMQPCHNARD